jgi:CubicO group peptidase (beta-lactamase class C family)
MTSDHLTPRQKAVSKFVWPPGFFEDFGWGFGMGINTRRTHLGPSAGSYGWYGKYGTTWFNDPAEDMITILIVQSEYWRLPVFLDFWTAAYQAIDD